MKKINPVYVLALGAFSIITTEFGVVGLMPQIMSRFHINESEAGILVSLYALIVCFTAPITTLLLSRFNHKKVMIASLLIFALSNLGSAFTQHFGTLLFLRVLPAFLHAGYWSFAFAAATLCVRPEHIPRAAATVMAGGTIATVLGIPLTSFIANHLSYEAAFWVSSAINLLAILGLIYLLPASAASQATSYRQQLRVLKKPALWLNVWAVSFIGAAMFSIYTYFSPYLSEVTNMSANSISAMLMLYGLAGVFGNILMGRLLSRFGVIRMVFFYPLAFALTLLGIFYWGKSAAVMIPAVMIWGMISTAGFIVGQVWISRQTTDAPAFGNSLFVSFINAGIALGAICGGWTLTHFGIHHVVWTSVLFLVAAFLCIAIKLHFFSTPTHR